LISNLTILTHDGKEYLVEVENYNPIELNKQLNDNQVNTVLIGDKILSRITVKEVIPIE
jgi:hypothetical protein